jgi:antitoxin component of MazEF toxin-antitoxin module
MSSLKLGGETTTLTKNTREFASLKATIPMFIVKQWGLQAGDKLEWSFDVCKDNEMVVVVRKAKKQKNTTRPYARP